MNQASATDGVLIEQSVATSPSGDADAHAYTEMSSSLRTNPVTTQAYHAVAASVEVVGTYARLVVKHGGVVPTTFYAKLIGCGIT